MKSQITSEETNLCGSSSVISTVTNIMPVSAIFQRACRAQGMKNYDCRRIFGL